MRKVLLGLLLLMAGALFSAEGTATVVRAHPWLTRGLERESLVGLRFENAYGGALDQVTFSFTLEHCTKADLSDFRLWIQPGPAYAFYESSAVRLDAGIMTKRETGEAGATTFTVTFENPDYASITAYDRTQGWVFAADRVWLTASVNPEISRVAKIRVDVASEEVRLGTNLYRVAKGSAETPHRVYPYLYRIGAYLPAQKALGGNFYRDATQQRVANLTELTHFEVYPVYNAEVNAFGVSWTDTDTKAYGQLAAARDAYHPRREDGSGARLILGLTKGATLSLASQGTSAFKASALGHASGDVYRAGFVGAVVTLMEAKGFDGLDIDWEYPNTYDGITVNNGEYAKYGLLLRDLAEAFFDRGWTLSICTNQSGWQMPGGEVMAAADYIDSMAYGPWPTFLGNAVMTQGINVCTSRNVPKRRIVVGQSIYSNANNQYGWGSLAAWVLEDCASWPERWDCDTVWRAWTNPNNGESGAYANFTGPTTYRAKCNRARLEGYGGVMSWGYYSDTAWEEGLSLAMHQAQAIWPHDAWPEPPRADDGFYELDSEEDWFWFREHPSNNVRLTGNLTFTHDPSPVESFSGVFDGGGHTLTLPKDVWLCTFGATALFREVTGTLRNLTVELAGRVVSRADRANDTAIPGNNTLATPSETAVLAASLGNGGSVENVTVRVLPEAEVQGVLKTAAVVASAWCPADGSATMRNVQAEIEGTVRAYADNSGGRAFDPSNACVGALIGWLGCPSGGQLSVEDCFVRLGASARVLAETGTGSSAGGAIGALNNTNPNVHNLNVRWVLGAEVSGKQSTETTPMPWIASYSLQSSSLPDVSGKILGPREGFPFTDWWLRTRAPFGVPAYTLRLR